MSVENEMKVIFDSRSCNESFARITAAAFMTQLNPTVEEVADVKTAVSEAVTNAIIHGYDMEVHKIEMTCCIESHRFIVVIQDYGKGIEDVDKAMEPLYTSRPDLERSGMGFAFMEAFMDDIKVESSKGEGTKVTMYKTIGVVEG